MIDELFPEEHTITTTTDQTDIATMQEQYRRHFADFRESWLPTFVLQGTSWGPFGNEGTVAPIVLRAERMVRATFEALHGKLPTPPSEQVDILDLFEIT